MREGSALSVNQHTGPPNPLSLFAAAAVWLRRPMGTAPMRGNKTPAPPAPALAAADRPQVGRKSGPVRRWFSFQRRRRPTPSSLSAWLAKCFGSSQAKAPNAWRVAKPRPLRLRKLAAPSPTSVDRCDLLRRDHPNSPARGANMRVPLFPVVARTRPRAMECQRFPVVSFLTSIEPEGPAFCGFAACASI